MRLRALSLVFFAGAAFCLRAESFRFSADRMSGSRASGRESTVLEGSAMVVSDKLVLKADRVELSGENNRFVDCSGSVEGTEEDKGVHFRTQRLRYDRTTKVARLEGDSVMEDKKNKVVAKGRFIEYADKTGVTVLQVGVRLFKDKLVCRSEWALYRREEKTLDLAGLPVVYKDGDEFRADRMRVDLDTDDIAMEGSVSGSLKEKPKSKDAASKSADSPKGAPKEGAPKDGAPSGAAGPEAVGPGGVPKEGGDGRP